MKECCNINNVVKEFYDSLYAYTLNKTHNKELSEDIVQEVMFRIIQAHSKESIIGNVRAWLYQTTRFVIADFYRDKEKSPIQLDDELKDFDTIPMTDHTISIIIDGMSQLIQLLPEKYAVPLTLSDIDEIPQKEIADKLGLSLSATKMRIQRARQKLHEMFLDCCDISYDKNGAFVSCSIKAHCDPMIQIEADLGKKK